MKIQDNIRFMSFIKIISSQIGFIFKISSNKYRIHPTHPLLYFFKQEQLLSKLVKIDEKPESEDVQDTFNQFKLPDHMTHSTNYYCIFVSNSANVKDI